MIDGAAAPLLVAVAVALVLAAGQPAPASADLLPPQIHTVAGGGSCAGEPASVASGGTCDGVSPTSIPIVGVRSVSALPGGGYLFVDAGDDLVREVTPSGIVETVAGTVSTNPSTGAVSTDTEDAPDGSIATESGLDQPVAVSALPDGSFLITEYAGCRVRLVSPGGPGVATITTVAGIPPDPNDPGATGCTSGLNQNADGPAYSPSGPATSVSLNYPTDAEPAADGGVLIADTYNDVIRYVSDPGEPDSTVTTVAGGGACAETSGVCGGLPADSVALDAPDSVSPLKDGSGGYLIAESGADTVDEVSGESSASTFTTVAGSPGTTGYSGDGGPATAATLNQPEQVLALSGGGFLIADTDNEVIREVSPGGMISTIAGDGFASFAGDGGAATAASLDAPAAVAPLANGNMLIADQDNNRIREVTIPSVSSFSVHPPTPTGSDGWYVTYPTVAVSANEKATPECEVDPSAAPAVYGEIPVGCPFGGSGAVVTGNGSHTIYAASENSFGDQENPVGLTIKIDVGTPTITCDGDPTFALDDPTAQVTGTLADSVSGPASEPISAGAATSSVGSQTAPLSGSNNAGGLNTAECPYYVTPLTLDPMPVAASTVKTSTTLSTMIVQDIPADATVEVTCTGKSCPFTRRTVRTALCRSCTLYQPAARMVALAPLFRKATLKAGTKIAVVITKADTVGRYVQFTVRAGKRPLSRSECLLPGATKPGKSCLPPRTTAVPASTPALSAHAAKKATAPAGKLTLKELMADPPKCLKRSGFGHIAMIKKGIWQGTIGEEPRTKRNDSAFVQGPFRSDGAATTAARRDSLVELAYAGGLFIVTASNASYLNQEASLAAACLASLTESKHLTF